jgi:hypothetical protein
MKERYFNRRRAAAIFVGDRQNNVGRSSFPAPASLVALLNGCIRKEDIENRIYILEERTVGVAKNRPSMGFVETSSLSLMGPQKIFGKNP